MINTIVNKYGRLYKATYGNGMSNHLPMAQVALYRLTNDVDAVSLFTESYMNHVDLEATEGSSNPIVNLEDRLGDGAAYEAYLEFFKKNVEVDGINHVLLTTLNALIGGLLGGAFHTIIKLAYAVESENVDEIIAGLAYLASGYLELPEPMNQVPIEHYQEAFDQVRKDGYFDALPLADGPFVPKLGKIISDSNFERMNFRLLGDVNDQYRLILDYAVNEYIHTGSFLQLHTITALHALLVLEPFLHDFEKAMITYTTAYISTLLAVKERSDSPVADDYEFIDWEYALTYALSTSDAHSIKFMYTCSELYTLTENPKFLKAVGIRLTQDSTL